MKFFDSLKGRTRVGAAFFHRSFNSSVINLSGTTTGRTSHFLVTLAIVTTGTLDFSVTTTAGTGYLPGAATSSAGMCHSLFLLSLVFLIIPTMTAVIHGFLMEYTVSLTAAIRIVESASCANLLCHLYPPLSALCIKHIHDRSLPGMFLL